MVGLSPVSRQLLSWELNKVISLMAFIIILGANSIAYPRFILAFIYIYYNVTRLVHEM